MGVQGLLGVLKSISVETNISQYRGQSIGIDGYAWLHRGAISCARDLATGKYTKRHLDFFIRRLRTLIINGVTPFVVFDGDYLPTKGRIEKSRENSRSECLEQGIILLRRGQSQEAEKFFQKAVDITPEIVAQLIEILKRENIQYVVAPYEADAQLVYLEKTGAISAIIAEDSDLLVFGASVLLTKMDDQGKCISVERRNFKNCKELVLTDLTDAQFRAMALFSGCDYSNGIPKIGLKKAHFYIRKYTTAERALRCMRCDGFEIPTNFENEFEQGDITFQYQRVYSITQKKLVHLNDPPMKLSPEAEIYVGQLVDDEISQGIASGHLNPFTKQPIQQSILHKTPTTVSLPHTNSLNASASNRISMPMSASNNTKITQFFTPSKKVSPNTTKRASSSYMPTTSSRPAARNVNSEIVLPLKTPETAQKSLVRRRVDRFIGSDEKKSVRSTASSQATIADPISSTESGTTLGNNEERAESTIQHQVVSKFFSSVSSRSKTVDDSLDEKSRDEKFVNNFISSVTSKATTLEDSFKFPSDSDSDDEFDIPSKPPARSALDTPMSSTAKNPNIWSRSSKIVFEKKEDNKITTLTVSQQERVMNLKKFAYSSSSQSSSSSTPAVIHRPNIGRANAQTAHSISSYETPQSTKTKTFLVSDPRELIDPDSDSGSSDVETPKHMRVNENVNFTLKDTGNCPHLQSPTRGVPSKKVRVTATTSRALFTTAGPVSRMSAGSNRESLPNSSFDSLSKISNKFAEFCYVPKK